MSAYKGPTTKEYYFNKNYVSNNYNTAKEICKSKGYGWDIADFGFTLEKENVFKQEKFKQDKQIKKVRYVKVYRTC